MNKQTTQRAMVLFGFVIMVGVLASVLYTSLVDRSEDSPTTLARSVLSGTELIPYEAKEFGFIIGMPGTPTASTATYQSNGKQLEVSMYQKVAENSTKHYTIAVYNYTGLEVDAEKTLKEILSTTIADTPGSKLISSENVQYLNNASLDGTYTVNNESGEAYEAYIRLIHRGNYVYAVGLTGGDRAGFDEYVNSLKFN